MKRPWADKADELEPKEGVWCDFVAWRMWLEAQHGAGTATGTAILEHLDRSFDHLDIALYCIFCDLYDKLPDLPEFMEAQGAKR